MCKKNIGNIGKTSCDASFLVLKHRQNIGKVPIFFFDRFHIKKI